MAWISTEPVDDATKEELLEARELATRSRGKFANILAVHGLLPETLGAHLELYKAVMFNPRSGLSRLDRELVAVIVSLANGCPYCVEHHGRALLALGVSEKSLRRILTDWRQAELTEAQCLQLEYAERLTTAPEAAEGSWVAELEGAGLDDRSILALNLIVAYFNFVNRIALGLGVELEDDTGGYRYQDE